LLALPALAQDKSIEARGKKQGPTLEERIKMLEQKLEEQEKCEREGITLGVERSELIQAERLPDRECCVQDQLSVSADIVSSQLESADSRRRGRNLGRDLF
jgi:hypothetical protein